MLDGIIQGRDVLEFLTARGYEQVAVADGDFLQCLEAVRRKTGADDLQVTNAARCQLGDGLVEATPEQAAEAVPVRIRVFRDRCTISIDTSGEPLHRRGWRLESTKAPLREDLARGLVLASGWEPGTPLVDPMCGAGTLEASWLKRKPPSNGK